MPQGAAAIRGRHTRVRAASLIAAMASLVHAMRARALNQWEDEWRGNVPSIMRGKMEKQYGAARLAFEPRQAFRGERPICETNCVLVS